MSISIAVGDIVKKRYGLDHKLYRVIEERNVWMYAKDYEGSLFVLSDGSMAIEQHLTKSSLPRDY